MTEIAGHPAILLVYRRQYIQHHLTRGPRARDLRFSFLKSSRPSVKILLIGGSQQLIAQGVVVATTAAVHRQTKQNCRDQARSILAADTVNENPTLVGMGYFFDDPPDLGSEYVQGFLVIVNKGREVRRGTAGSTIEMLM